MALLTGFPPSNTISPGPRIPVDFDDVGDDAGITEEEYVSMLWSEEEIQEHALGRSTRLDATEIDQVNMTEEDWEFIRMLNEQCDDDVHSKVDWKSEGF